MTLRVVALTAMAACAIGVSACSGAPHKASPSPAPSSSEPPPVTGIVDRVSPFGPTRAGSGGSYFTLEGDVATSYVCYGADCATLEMGDRITFTVTVSYEGKLNQVQNLEHTPR
jgi:hypothetical protein